MLGAEFPFPDLQRLLEEREGPVQLPGSPGSLLGEAMHGPVSVLGSSGPSVAFMSFSVSSKSGRARSSFPAAQ